MTEQKHRARLHLGYFDTADEAKRARFEAESKLAATDKQPSLLAGTWSIADLRAMGVTSSPEAPQATIAPDRVSIPANVNLVPTKPLTLDLDTWLYTSDFHAPLHNKLWTKRLANVANRHNVSTLVIGGDLFDFDSTSRHPKTEQQSGLNQTLKSGGDLLCWLSIAFDRIYVLPGNHCRRVATKLDEPLEFDALIHAAVKGRIAAGKIVTTDYDYIYIGQEDSGWVVGHPRYFSIVPAKGGADVAMLQRRNVIGAHNHIIGLSQSKDGRFWSIDPGHMTDPSMTPYLMQSNGLSRYPTWRNGFVLVDNNIPTIFADGLTDWSRYV
jgi:hypothetical protein